jgi:hypothetical protein
MDEIRHETTFFKPPVTVVDNPNIPTLQYVFKVAPHFQRELNLPAEIIADQVQDYSLRPSLEKYCPNVDQIRQVLATIGYKDLMADCGTDADSIYDCLEKHIWYCHQWMMW